MRFQMFSALLGAVVLTGCTNETVCSPDDCIDQVYVHKYGVKVRPDYWTEKGRNGQIVNTMRDGVVVTQTYCAGELHGETCYTYPNSPKVCRSEIYKNNQLEAENQFYPSGQAKRRSEWTGPNQKTVTCWYECGTPRCVEKIEDGRLLSGEYFTKQHHRDSWVYNGEGERVSRDWNGRYVCLDEFCGGEVIRRTYFYPSKGPREIISFMNGVPHGERKTFYPDGSPCSTESWECGRQNGTTVIYQNGERYAEIPYLDGKKNGLERRYADGYNLSQEVTWYDGQMHGPTYTYAGDCIQTDWFYKGRMTSRSNFESYDYPPR
jgi:antitoxin component YwqK of YwqJK toxin-antitoxin module